MKLLFASPDRDLLAGYKSLLDSRDYAVTTAFDGTQVLTALEKDRPDVLALDEALPRVGIVPIVRAFRESGTPVVLLIRQAIGVRLLTEEPFVASCLAFPFQPGELIGRIQAVRSRAGRTGVQAWDGVFIDPAAFTMNGIPVTEEEIRVLEELENAENGIPYAFPERIYMGAINQKLVRSGSMKRIHYVAGEGYRLVNQHEYS